ncbi:GlxA family transcriptional regulator [Desulfatibacillum aliphaticivorans]|uniref:GlxA family transcriptional regulator n=1 Tax=Desulfatibacillum aliphaticivorans TaxID=218208 RepID=UPI000408C13B|nr:DJ-1/PfpI family protein [Desulfatibacillum aliphaticivorans]
MPHVIEIVLFPEVLGLDVFGPVEVFHTASRILEQTQGIKQAYSFRFAAAEAGPIRLSSGAEIMAQTDFIEPFQGDMLLIPGGLGAHMMAKNADFVKIIRDRAKQAKRILSVCHGAFLLAAAGLLDGKRAATHWLGADDLAAQYPKVRVEPDAIFIQDGAVYTSAGVTAGIDLALAVVEEDFGMATALDAARMLVLYYKRPGGQSQFSTPLKAQEAAGKRFSPLHNWLLKNLESDISVEDMANRSAMSERNFARVFKSETGMTPGKYLEALRLDRAREILISGGESLDGVAQASGFGREERFRRAFYRKFGVTPSQYRLHFAAG